MQSFDNYQPQPFHCSNKWCEKTPTSIPDRCATIPTLFHQRNQYGGVTGRGVTPCPFGYLETLNKQNKATITPLDKETPHSFSSIFFQPTLPGFLPPQGNVRPLRRIGYEWRNN